MPRYQRYARRLAVCVLLVLASTTACQPTPTTTEQFLPPYLRLRLCAGEAQMTQAGSSQWTPMPREVGIEGKAQVSSSTEGGVRLCFGDGSTLELAPETTVELSDPGVFPRLQLTVIEGSVLLRGTQRSYEFVLPECSVTLLSVPSRLRVKSEGETARLTVETGSATCTYRAEALVLTECWGVYALPGREPLVSNFCAAMATATAEAMAHTPSPTPEGAGATASPTPSPSPAPTREGTPPTPTPPPPTDTPLPPPPPPPNTRPPPTNTPAPTSTSPPTATPSPTPTPTPTIRPTLTPSTVAPPSTP